MKCINCGHEHEHAYCPACGQKAQVDRITLNTVFQEFFSTITNMDKGFLLNLKNGFLKPQELAKNYLKGQRNGLMNPISFLVICVTIYLLVDSFFKAEATGPEFQTDTYSVGYNAGNFLYNYSKYFWILVIVWFAFSTKLIFGRYFYAEHLAISAFVIGQSTLVGILGITIARLGIVFNPLVYLFALWMTYKIFKSKPRDFEAFSLAFATILLFFIQLVTVVVLIGLVKTYVL